MKSKIINKNGTIELENNKLIPYLYDLIEKDLENKKIFELYKRTQLIIDDMQIIDYFVKFLGYTIISNGIVYFQSSSENEIIDRIGCIKKGLRLKKLPKMVLKNGKIQKYLNPIQQEVEKLGIEHSMSPENDFSYWYPKTANIGFKTPKTIITKFTNEEIKLIKTGKWTNLDEKDLLKRIEQQAYTIDLNQEMFIRLGNSSNKFNFDSCHISNIYELYKKLMIMLDDMVFKLEWQQNIELILREYIKTNYQRSTIYNGMPLNTEFRVFYDFDENIILGIFNYWDTNTMLDNLYNEQDLINFASEAKEIESDFNNLYPYLKEEAKEKLPIANLRGKWSVDFLYDGRNFVLIDMAHAECSYYYDKVLGKQLTLR